MTFLITDKTAKKALQKIKMFITLNKKPTIIQTDNRLEFRNRMLTDFLNNESIKHILNRPHHPKTNGCLERYHREAHKYMKNYLNNLKDFTNIEIENGLEKYIYVITIQLTKKY